MLLHSSYRFLARGITNPPTTAFGGRQTVHLRLPLLPQPLVGFGPYTGLSRHLQTLSTVVQHRRNLTMGSSTGEAPRRRLSTVTFTKNMTFYSSEATDFTRDPKTLRLKTSLRKPMVLILAWLQATEKHLAKYAEFYLDQGFEVLVVHISPWQLMWPVNGTQAVANDVVKFLRNNEFPGGGVVLHGFSVGGYLWGECLVKIDGDSANRCVRDKIVGQVWDSAADITEIPVGVPHAVLPRNPGLQNALRSYITYHLKLFHEEATQYYLKSTELFHHEPIRCPALMLVSKTDPVGTVAANQKVRDDWEAAGVKTTFKCWDKSPHVGHFHKHREEYVELLLTHLRSLNLPSNNRKAKL